MRSRITKPVFDRDEYYESSSRLVRWICLALVLITYPFGTQSGTVVLTMVIGTGIYNGLRYSRALLSHELFGSRLNTIAVDHIFVLALVGLSGGLASPYYPLFFLLIIAVIASYGIAGFAFSLTSQVLITLILLNVNLTTQPADANSQFIIKLVLLIVFSLVAEQSVRSHDEEYLLASRFTHRIEDERQRLLSLINSLSNAVLAVDEHGKVYLHNAAALELLDTNSDINGHAITELLPLKNHWNHRVDLMRLIAAKDQAVNRQDLFYTAADGSKVVLDLTVSPVHVFGYDKGNWGGYMVVFRDITKQKSLDEQRDEFINVVSHELRTPVAIAEANLSTSLLPGFAHIPPNAKELIKQAHDNTVFLGQLIQDLTTLASAERNDLKLQLELVDIGEFAEQLIRDYRASAEHHGLKLELKAGDRLGSLVTSQREMREVLQNFLTNAIKYTKKGRITLEVTRTPTGADFTVRDTGIGISTSDQRKIFTKFYRSEDYRTRETGGTGLGLYITTKLATKMGAKITFNSRLNHGSAFTLSVPNAQLDPTPPADNSSAIEPVKTA